MHEIRIAEIEKARQENPPSESADPPATKRSKKVQSMNYDPLVENNPFLSYCYTPQHSRAL